MAIQTELRSFERIALEIGASPALLLVSFFAANGRTTVYIPEGPTSGHVIERLIGTESWRWLVEAFGGETIHLPSLDGLKHVRLAGRVAALSRHGVSTPTLAKICNVSQRRIEQVKSQLKLEGFGDLLDNEAELEEYDHA